MLKFLRATLGKEYTSWGKTMELKGKVVTETSLQIHINLFKAVKEVIRVVFFTLFRIKLYIP